MALLTPISSSYLPKLYSRRLSAHDAPAEQKSRVCLSNASSSLLHRTYTSCK
ncbi:hypothetical protein Hanom_Chr12g01159901 [Helianthus anomalus]